MLYFAGVIKRPPSTMPPSDDTILIEPSPVVASGGSALRNALLMELGKKGGDTKPEDAVVVFIPFQTIE